MNKIKKYIEEKEKDVLIQFHEHWTEQYVFYDYRRLKGRRAIDAENWLRENISQTIKGLIDIIIEESNKLQTDGNYTMKEMEAIFQEGYLAHKRDITNKLKTTIK